MVQVRQSSTSLQECQQIIVTVEWMRLVQSLFQDIFTLALQARSGASLYACFPGGPLVATVTLLPPQCSPCYTAQACQPMHQALDRHLGHERYVL